MVNIWTYKLRVESVIKWQIESSIKCPEWGKVRHKCPSACDVLAVIEESEWPNLNYTNTLIHHSVSQRIKTKFQRPNS